MHCVLQLSGCGSCRSCVFRILMASGLCSVFAMYFVQGLDMGGVVVLACAIQVCECAGVVVSCMV